MDARSHERNRQKWQTDKLTQSRRGWGDMSVLVLGTCEVQQDAAEHGCAETPEKHDMNDTANT